MITELPSCGPRSARRLRISGVKALIALVLVAVLGGSVASAQSPTEPIPDLGTPTSDGFVAKCYWVGTFKSGIRARGQGVIDAFGQSLSPLCYDQVTDCNFIATEEADGSGKMRVVLRSAKWSTSVSNLHFWFRPSRKESAGGNVGAQGNLPLTGPGAPQLTVSHREGFVDMNLQVDPTIASLKFDVVHRTTAERPRSLWKIYPIVYAGGPNTTEHWIAPIHGISASDEPVTSNRRTVIRREWGDPEGSEYYYWVVTRVCEHSDVVVKLITPRGDPVTVPKTSGDGQNEWTFNSAIPGKLTVTFKAEVSPPSAAARTRDRIRFEMEPIPGSAFAWDHNNPGGRPVVDGRFLVATATSTGLPSNNEDFGKKKVRLLMDGEVIAQTYIEVFFPRDARNNPGPRANTPNWFYYYMQTVPLLGPNPKIQYSSDHSSHYDIEQNEICIDDGAIQDYPAPYVPGTLYGIDTFAWCVTHEMQHYKDWADFWDVDRSGTAKHSAALGKTGPDHDRDGDMIPNKIEDANGDGVFNTGDLYNWQLERTPGPPAEIVTDFEDWNCKRHSSVRGDHKQDWADPGMQHKTLHRYDD